MDANCQESLTPLDRVKRCRKDLGVSYKGMANHSGVSLDTFYQFSCGKRELNEDNLKSLLNFLETLGY